VIMQHAVAIGFELRVLSSFVLTVMLAAASYKLLEQPFLRLKKRFSFSSGPDDVDRPSRGRRRLMNYPSIERVERKSVIP
ncbi:MAG TPA: hypothetical protein VFB65_04870, partial [Pyrinomonadaceae bacterium]|nr:hypothetical protein [Pyrinomonadaceae bacterium]